MHIMLDSFTSFTRCPLVLKYATIRQATKMSVTKAIDANTGGLIQDI